MKRPVQHTAGAVAEWLREGKRVVAGLLVEVEGSSPLDVGASMYIDEAGGVEGSITRGGGGGGGGPPPPPEIPGRRGAAAPGLPRRQRARRPRRGGVGG